MQCPQAERAHAGKAEARTRSRTHRALRLSPALRSAAQQGHRVHRGGARRLRAARPAAAARRHAGGAGRARLQALRSLRQPTSSATPSCASCRTPTRRCSTRCWRRHRGDCCRSSTRRPWARLPAVQRHLPQAARPVPQPIRSSDRIAQMLDNPRLRRASRPSSSPTASASSGLGDQGAGGMGIPIGKLSLYTALRRHRPGQRRCRSCSTSAPTTPSALDDPLYIGWRHERVRGEDYDDFIEAFVSAVERTLAARAAAVGGLRPAQRHAPAGALSRPAVHLQRRHPGHRGGGAGTLLAAVKVTGEPLADQRVVMFGAGSAGCGIASAADRSDDRREGSRRARRARRFYMVDSAGLAARRHGATRDFQRHFVQPRAEVAAWTSRASRPDHAARRGAQRQSDGADRRLRPARRLHRGRRARHGRASRAADRLPAVESDPRARGDAGRHRTTGPTAAP